MHLILASNQTGHKVLEDPYLRLTGRNSELRDAFKLVALVVLDSTSREEATRALNNKIMEKRLILPEDVTTRDAIDRFFNKFPKLNDLMF
jgi:hypothetical protein